MTSDYGTASHDAAVAGDLLADEDGPRIVLGDSAYDTGALRAHLRAQGHTAIIKPPVLRMAVPGGFSIDDFTINTAAGTATCPTGHTVRPPPRQRAR